MRSKESGIFDQFFEYSVIIHLVSKSIVVESGIRDIFWICVMSCTLYSMVRVMVRVRVFGVHLSSPAMVRVRVRVCGYA